MGQKPTVKSLTAGKYDAEYPNAPTLTLAKKMYAENKSVFTNLEDARSSIRYCRGQSGDKKRKERSSAAGENIDRRTFNYNPFKIPKSEDEEWALYKMPKGDYKTLILSDIHLPYHSEKALDLSINYGLKNDCKTLFINGDLFDAYSLSRFEKDPRKRHFADELEMTRDFLKECKKHFEHVYYKLGNHCERFEKYMRIKAPELLSIPEFELASVLHQGSIGFHMIDEKRIVRLGYLNILHGHEFYGGTSQAVNPARGVYLKTAESCITGHLHKSSSHTDTSLTGKITTTWSTGCLCGLHPDYARINKWNHGFAVVESYKDGTYHVHNKTIYDGKVL